MLRCFLFLSCSLLSTGVFAQADTIRIYYPIDESRISAGDKERLATFLNSSPNKQFSITGFTDYLGNAPYNLALSARRAEMVKQYLLSIDNKITAIATGNGQIDEPVKHKTGNPKTRKVELIVVNKATIVTAPIEPIAQISPPVAVPPKTDSNIIKKQAFKKQVDSLFNGEVGSSLALKELIFWGGTHVLKPQSTRYLPILLDYLLSHPKVKIEIQGHICCQPGEADGLDMKTGEYKLSRNRAKAIYDYLAENGIKRSHMRYRGFAMTRPKIWPEMSEEDANLNRRVEILILEK